MTASDKSNGKKTLIFYIVIVVLAVLCGVQAFLLFRRGQTPEAAATAPLKQERPEKQEPQNTASAAPTGALWEELNQAQSKLNQFFNAARGYGTPFIRDLHTALESDFFPVADLNESKDAYFIQLDLPGLSKENISINLRGNQVVIQGQREETTQAAVPSEGFYGRERRYGTFKRTFTLPGPVKESEISAAYDQGVLSVKLPKQAEPETVRKIPVQ